VYVSELKNLKSHKRLLWGTRDEKNLRREIRSQSGRDTSTCTQAWDSRSRFNLFSSFLTVAERQSISENVQTLSNRQSDMRSPDKAGIKPLEKLSCASTHLRWDITCSQSECETSCLDIMMKHQKSLGNGWAGAKTGYMTSSPSQIKGTVLIWKVTCLLTLMSFKPLWLWPFTTHKMRCFKQCAYMSGNFIVFIGFTF